MAGVLAMVLVIIVVLVSVIYPSKVASQIAIPDVNRSWTLPAAQGNMLELTLPFLMTYREHRSVGGYLFDYFEGHQEISHGMFSTADIQFSSYVCADPPGLAKEPTNAFRLNAMFGWLPLISESCRQLISCLSRPRMNPDSLKSGFN
jgi:hypothetical protein